MSHELSINKRPTKRSRLVSVLLANTDNDVTVESDSESTSDVDPGSNERCRGSVNDDGSEEDVHTDNEEVSDDDMSDIDADEQGMIMISYFLVYFSDLLVCV